MESRLGHDLSDVRVHDDERARFTARTLGTRGFAVGRDVVLSDPGDERLLAHELAHVVQQERSGPTGDSERGARLAEQGDVSSSRLGAAAPGFHAQDEEEWPTRVESAFTLDWTRFARTNRFSLGVPQLTLGPTPPVLLPPPVLPGGPILPPLTAPSTTGTPPTPAARPHRRGLLGCIVLEFASACGSVEPEAKSIPGRLPRRRSRSRSGGARS